jgi:hypothetical protein
MFGLTRLRKLMAKETTVPSGSSSAAVLIELLLASLAGFTGPVWEQEDDVTRVTLDYVGSEWPLEDQAQVGERAPFTTNP